MTVGIDIPVSPAITQPAPTTALKWSGTPTSTSKSSSFADAAKSILENYYRGKISKADMEAQQRALAQQRQQSGIGQYMPLLMIGGAVLLAVVLLRR
jgi:hypothetical protein